MTATSTGPQPISSDACVTLVMAMPTFCTRTEPPSPSAPQPSTGARNAARSAVRSTVASSTAAASANLTTTSQAGGSQASAALDSGTLVPQGHAGRGERGDGTGPAAASAAGRRRVFMPLRCR